MAEDTEIDYDLDPADAPPPVKVEKPAEKKPVETVEEKPAPKHKSYFLRAAAKAGISEAEANELEPDELERAIRLAASASPAAAPPPPPAAKSAEEEADDDDFADLEGYDEVFQKRFKKLHGKLKEFEFAAKTVKTIEERERKREELEFTRKIDSMFAKSGVPALGDKPFDEYSPDSPEIESRKQIWAAAAAGQKPNEKFETALKRTLSLFQLVKPEAKPEAKAKPEADPEIKKKLDDRRKEWDSDGAVATPAYHKRELNGHSKALQGIAATLAKANERDRDE
jgi:hypothetical protein